MIDEQSEAQIRTLDVRLQPIARMLLNEAYKQGIQLRITEGARSFERQAELYAQGRTTPGDIVTKAMPGESAHNYGLAFDVYEVRNGSVVLSGDNPNWPKIGAIGKSLGLRWGGDWGWDKPHFENLFGSSVQELKSAHLTAKTATGFGLLLGLFGFGFSLYQLYHYYKTTR
jgi:peptidoglycan LD-endopeptidase CwlK